MKRFVTFLAALVLFAAPLSVGAEDALIQRALELPVYVGSSEGDWLVYALASAGFPDDEFYSKYRGEYQAYICDNYSSFRLATDYQRLALVYGALGGNARDVDGAFDLVSDGIFFSETLATQGVNAYIWALIAIDKLNVDEPANALNTKLDLIEALLGYELAGGGFALSGTVADTDITAQAVRALAAYTGVNREVSDAVSRAVDKLAAMRDPATGLYGSYGTINAESTAQVVLALHRVGAEGDERFAGLVEGLEAFRTEDGLFSHLSESGAKLTSTIATAQVIEALAASGRLVHQENADEAAHSTSEDDPENGIAGYTGEEIEQGWGALVNIVLVMVLIFAALIIMDKVAKNKKAAAPEDEPVDEPEVPTNLK